MHRDHRAPNEVRAHFEVERELASRLRRSSRAERTTLFKTLYAELFARVPNHARIVRRDSPEASARAVDARMRLLQPHLDKVKTFVEIAPGDCRLAWAVAARVPEVIGIDISDQSGEGSAPQNFRLMVYDGYTVDLPDGCADLVFSYQLLEHLHPDDMLLHFQLVHRLLKPGGSYVFSTPHRHSGPHDISRYFSDVPQGFHLKEWTYWELASVAKEAGFRHWKTYRLGQLRDSWTVNGLTLLGESFMALWPKRLRRRLAARAFEGVTMLVRK
jgi:SAM-dependent methyltransferase